MPALPEFYKRILFSTGKAWIRKIDLYKERRKPATRRRSKFSAKKIGHSFQVATGFYSLLNLYLPTKIKKLFLKTASGKKKSASGKLN